MISTSRTFRVACGTLLLTLPLHTLSMAAQRCRIVDYGHDMGSGYYRGEHPPTRVDGAIDVDGDSQTSDDTVTYWKFSLTEHLNPPGLYFDVDAPSAIMYGGIIGLFANTAQGTLTEGMLNENHNLRDDYNMMCNASGQSWNNKGYGVWLWQKEDFLNGGNDCTVTFGSNSLIAAHISRYYAGVDGGRWLARDGDQFYLSEYTFYDYQTNIGRAEGTHTTYQLNPAMTRWAPYNPSGPYYIWFDATGAVFQAHTFTNVTAVGFHIFKDVISDTGMQVKWNAFETYALVDRPDTPSYHVPMVTVPAGTLGGQILPSFSISATEIDYATWQRVWKWAASGQYCRDLEPGYILDADGDMGSMSLGNGTHSACEPATVMTWYDAVAWCNALSELEGLAPCYYADSAKTTVLRQIKNRDFAAHYDDEFHVYVDWSADGFRLPTMTEWSYAALAGAGSLPSSTSDGWVKANSSNTTHAVGLLNTNAWGLADVLGNVWEYTWDVASAGDHFAPGTADQHTVLGGGFRHPDDPTTNSPMPFGEVPFNGGFDIGLRIVRGGSPPPAAQVVAGVPARLLVEDAWIAPAVSAPLPSITNDLVYLAGTNSYPDTGETDNLAYQRIDEAHVTITPFYMSAHEITYALWNNVYQWAVHNGYAFDFDGDMGSMDYCATNHRHSADEPVTGIGWNDTIVWCNALSELEGRQPCYYADAARTQILRVAGQWRIRMEMRSLVPGHADLFNQFMDVYVHWDHDGYRLPTEAEWEVAYRDGRTTPTVEFPWSGDASAAPTYSWVVANSGGTTHPVGLKTPNGYGLYDLAGNVAEWVWDWPGFNYYLPHNPKGDDVADAVFGKAIRGASFGVPPVWADHRDRDQDRESAARPTLGLRVVRCDLNEHPVSNVFVPPTVLTYNTNDYDRLDGKVFRYNLWRQGAYPVAEHPREFKTNWVYTTGGAVRSSPVVVDGVVYIGSDDGNVYALDAATGSNIWTFAADPDRAVRGSAAVVDGSVYIGCDRGARNVDRGYLYAIDAATGTQRWKFTRGTTYNIDAGPAVAYGLVFAAFGRWGDRYWSGIDVNTGGEKWRYRSTAANDGPIGPAVDMNSLYVPGGDFRACRANLRDEQTLWIGIGGHCHASLALADNDRAVYLGAYDAYCFRRSDGFKFWRKSLGTGLDALPESSPAVGNVDFGFGVVSNVAFFGHRTDYVYAYDVLTGGQIWKYRTEGHVNSSPALAGNVVYIGSDDSNLYCFAASNGDLLWQFQTDGMVRSSPWVGTNGVVYVGSDDGNVYCLSAPVPESIGGTMVGLAAWLLRAATRRGL